MFAAVVPAVAEAVLLVPAVAAGATATVLAVEAVAPGHRATMIVTTAVIAAGDCLRPRQRERLRFGRVAPTRPLQLYHRHGLCRVRQYV